MVLHTITSRGPFGFSSDGNANSRQGTILASVVNIFWHSSGLYWVVTYAGILIFVGLTAYDAQKIKRMHAAGMEGTEEDRKAAVVGALALYLDFINLFLLLLRLFGRKK